MSSWERSLRITAGGSPWLWVPGLSTYHSSPVHREAAIRLHDNGAEFDVLRVSAAALWSEPAHWVIMGRRAGTETQCWVVRLGTGAQRRTGNRRLGA